jgi:hypothetical protein
MWKFLLVASLGTFFGLLFGLPPAIAVCATNLPWFPWGLAASIPGLIVGDVLAWLVVRYVFGMTILKLQTPTRRRLAGAVADLQRLETERLRRADARYGKEAEDEIIWNELLDLEFHDTDRS